MHGLPKRLKSMLFEIFSHSAGPFVGPLYLKKFQTALILAFEANSALSCENETKIVKITHSAQVTTVASTYAADRNLLDFSRAPFV